MSTRDFTFIARTIHAESDFVVRSRTAMRFADALAANHPRFNRELFLSAAIDGSGL